MAWFNAMFSQDLFLFFSSSAQCDCQQDLALKWGCIHSGGCDLLFASEFIWKRSSESNYQVRVIDSLLVKDLKDCHSKYILRVKLQVEFDQHVEIVKSTTHSGRSWLSFCSRLQQCQIDIKQALLLQPFVPDIVVSRFVNSQLFVIKTPDRLKNTLSLNNEKQIHNPTWK
jgi:hypothetical protein